MSMDGDLKKELTWVFGTLACFIAFLFVGGITEISEIAISVGAFLLSWTLMSYFIKNYGPGGTSKEELENEFKWYTAILLIFLAIMTLIGTTDGELELTYSLYATLVFGFTLVWIVRSSVIKYFSK